MDSGRVRFLAAVLCLAAFSSQAAPAPASPQEPKDRRQEESVDYYAKWLKQDVVYIISDAERDLFEKLTTPEEKENFIEQFWIRRDPDPRTPANEFKTEHYRRIAYANEHFTSGDPGWMTDRGRIYILHGQPDSIESRPTGGTYFRPIEEGGGSTGALPFEKWRYRHIEGLGEEIELEFVDPTFTGEFRLAVYPWEKDAYLHSPGGATLAEQTGIATKADREAFSPAAGGAGNNPQTMFRRLRDTPFARYEKVAKAQAPKPLKFQDLKEFVKVNVNYSSLPVQIDRDYFRLNQGQALVPVTVRVRNRDLLFETVGDRSVARMAVYGLISSITNRYILEFEEEVHVAYSGAELEKGLAKTSVYQKVIPLDAKTRYKLDVVVKDLNSEALGTLRVALIPPDFEDRLSASTLLVSDQIRQLDAIPDDDEAFVLGDVQVLPNPEKRFSPEMPLGVYFQLYNFALDQSTFAPELTVTYRLTRDGELLRMAVDERGESIQFYSERRAVIVKLLSLQGLEPGDYRIQIEAEDRINDNRIELAEGFRVVRREDL